MDSKLPHGYVHVHVYNKEHIIERYTTVHVNDYLAQF